MQTLLIAARKPLFLAVLGVALVSGLFVAEWLGALGVLVYIVAVGMASRDSELLALRQRAENAQARQQRARGLSSQLFLRKIRGIEESQQQVERALQAAKGPLGAQLTATLGTQTDDLIEQAYVLARKGQDIETYLQQVDRTALQNQINQIDQRISRTKDAYTVDQLQGTRKALVEQLNSARVLETYIGRIESQLQNIEANLDTMPAQIIRMRASDVNTQLASEEIAQRLQDMNTDMNAFVSTLDTALGQTAAGAP